MKRLSGGLHFSSSIISNFFHLLFDVKSETVLYAVIEEDHCPIYSVESSFETAFFFFLNKRLKVVKMGERKDDRARMRQRKKAGEERAAAGEKGEA